jgi:hypothetical protein
MPATTLEPGFCSCLYARCIGITTTSTPSQYARVLCAPNLGGFDNFSRPVLPCSLFVDKPILGFFQVMVRNVVPGRLPVALRNPYRNIMEGIKEC